jgi:hypothetical protein
MTVEEYRHALGSLTPARFETFRERWGGARPTVDECVREFAYSPTPVQWEQMIVFHLRALGVEGLRTEDEKRLLVAQDAARAAQSSAAAALRSADSAAQSVRWSIWSVVIAILTVGVSVALQRC